MTPSQKKTPALPLGLTGALAAAVVEADLASASCLFMSSMVVLAFSLSCCPCRNSTTRLVLASSRSFFVFSAKHTSKNELSESQQAGNSPSSCLSLSTSAVAAVGEDEAVAAAALSC